MEYEAVISRILEAERSAQAITRDVRERQARLDEELERETAQVREQSSAAVNEKLDKLRREIQRHKEETLKAQDERLAESMARIERAYSQYGENWVDTLFRQIVGLEK